MKSRYINLALSILLIILVVNVVRSWFFWQKRTNIIKTTEKKLEDVQKEQDSLKREYARTQGSEYLERQARNKLNLGKEEEVIIFLPTISPVVEPSPTPTEIPVNWLKWVKVFN